MKIQPRFLIGLLFLGVSTIPVAANETAAATPDTERAIPSVTVAAAEMADMRAQVLVSGTLAARQEVLIYPQVSGYEVTELLVEAGDKVTAGQVLARLSADTLSAQLAQAEAEYQRADASVSQAQSQIASAEANRDQAVSALNRVQRLRRSGNAAQAALDDAVAAEASAQASVASAVDGLKVAQAALAQADAARAVTRLNLDRSQITAPVAGLIVERNAQLGAIAGSASEPMFTLIANGEVELSAEVIETALDQLAIGQLVEVQVAGVGLVEGRVRLIPAGVDPITRLGTMRISMENNANLRTGLFASGAIITAQRRALTVPATAVLSDDQGDTVRLVRDGVVHIQPVEASLLWQSRREIVQGLTEGQTVIARAGAFFRDGDHVVPVRPDQTAADSAAPSEGDAQALDEGADAESGSQQSVEAVQQDDQP